MFLPPPVDRRGLRVLRVSLHLLQVQPHLHHLPHSVQGPRSAHGRQEAQEGVKRVAVGSRGQRSGHGNEEETVNLTSESSGHKVDFYCDITLRSRSQEYIYETDVKMK